jgi:hypothetical protein
VSGGVPEIPEGWQVPERHRTFAQDVATARLVDPMPTLRNLSDSTGVPVEALIHLALVRWVSAGAEALMTVPSQALQDLIAARRREDWEKVAGMIDWMAAGL